MPLAGVATAAAAGSSAVAVNVDGMFAARGEGSARTVPTDTFDALAAALAAGTLKPCEGKAVSAAVGVDDRAAGEGVGGEAEEAITATEDAAWEGAAEVA